MGELELIRIHFLPFRRTTGRRIPAIENLGVAGVSCFLSLWTFGYLEIASPLLTTAKWEQPHDAIDFTDNDIQVLGNFPLSPRITTLLLARNRISSIQPSLARSIPSLTNLVLMSNNLAELADVDVLGTFPRLTHLVLADNPITKKEVSFLSSLISRLLFGDTGKADLGESQKALSLLDYMEMPKREVSGPRKGQGGREAERPRAVWHSRGARCPNAQSKQETDP